MATMFTLPPDVQLEYLAEGAANIVYRIKWPSSSTSEPHKDGTRTPPTEADLHNLPSATSSTTPPPTEIDPTSDSLAHNSSETYPPPELHSRLLRLRKDVAWIPSYADLYQTQATLINPHFPAPHLVPQTLVRLPQSLTQDTNVALLAAEEMNKQGKGKGRSEKRHGLYLAENEPHGMLVEDMSADTAKGETLVEVKAKWLAQSPNAPPGSTRCRTCALRAMRREQQKLGQKSSGGQSLANLDKDFCPLGLGSGDAQAVGTAVSAILVGALGPVSKDPPGRAALQRALTEYFLETPILPQLRSLQAKLDPKGVLNFPEGKIPEDDFLVATTLRDCTLFVRTSVQGDKLTVEGRLGDLDLKAPEPSKIDYWRGLERDLIYGGWYEGKGADGKCWLEKAGQ